MKIYFSHGKESGPWGAKIKRLASIAEGLGWDVESVDYSDLSDPDLRVQRLINILQSAEENFVLTGSSMGGYVSVAACEAVAPLGLFLMAPALYMPGYGRQQYRCANALVEVVHGWSDDVVPPENSIRFAREADCALHLIAGDHRLNASMDAVGILFQQFLVLIKSRQHQ